MVDKNRVDFGNDCWWIDPLVVFLDEVDESVYRLGLRDVELHWSLIDVEVDLVRSATDVAEVRICHLTWAIDDASHDGNAYALEVTSGSTDLLCGFL